MRSPRNKARCRGAFDRLENRQVLSLVLSPVNISAPQQGQFSGVVATLIDTNFNDTPSTFNKSPGSVQIDWGDGQPPSSGMVVGALLPGVFEVDASHVYTDAGSYATQITVTAQNGQDAIANGAATVTTEPQQLTMVGNTIGGTAGLPLDNVTVATFLDADPTDTASDFNALITWGDGEASIGSVAGANGAFTVTGSHTYSASGTYVTNVTLIGLNNGQSAFASGQATIAPASIYTMTGQQFIETAGVPFSVPVATFTDPNTSDPSTIFTASVNWGDGDTSGATVTGGNGSFTITGSHVYAVPGSFSVITTLVDMNNNVSMTTSSAVVTGPVLTPLPTTVTPSIGLPFTGVVAKFFDTNTSDSSKNLTATINWGNGNITTGTVLPVPGTPDLFAVQGTNTYTAAGTFSVSVLLVNQDGQSATAASNAVVAAPTILATGTTFPATPGVPLPANTVVANVIDTNPNATAQNIQATINWGDGQTSTGLVSATASPGSYVIKGSHTYASASSSGSYAVVVTIIDPSGQTATADSTAILAAPTIVATGTNFPMIPGQPLMNIVVATFTDANPLALANPAQISAVINWGNGDTSQGNVMPTASVGTFNVLSGSYAFPTPGPASTIPVTVTITDPSGQSATAQSIAYVVSTISNAGANPFQFTGSLALIGGNGPYAAKGFTNTNQPTFSGTAPLFSIVQLFARPFGVDTQIPLGTAVTNGSGQWSLTVGPLLAGQYNISAIVTPSGGYSSTMMSLSNDGLVHIDMVPKHAKPLPHPHPLSANHKTARLPKLVHHRPATRKHRS